MAVEKSKSQPSVLGDPASAGLRPTETGLAQSRPRVSNWLRQIRRDFVNDCRRLASDWHRALAIASKTLARWGAQILAATGRVAMRLVHAQETVNDVGRGIAFKAREIRPSSAAAEQDLHDLIDSSLDPVVLADGKRRLVAANARALELFGISESNMRNFTLDAFIASAESAKFDWKALMAKGGATKLNRCKIRRLDGGLLFAQCQFVEGVVPHRHLCKFLNVAPYKITSASRAKRYESEVSQTTVKGPANLVPDAKKAR